MTANLGYTEEHATLLAKCGIYYAIIISDVSAVHPDLSKGLE